MEKDKWVIPPETESTAAVSQISYMIEDMLVEKIDIEDIRLEIEERIKTKIFPPNLQLVEAFYDPITGTSGSSFIDTNTGEMILGYAGTNFESGKPEGLKDVHTDIRIALGYPYLSGGIPVEIMGDFHSILEMSVRQ